jgi:hypothetical protein
MAVFWFAQLFDHWLGEFVDDGVEHHNQGFLLVRIQWTEPFAAAFELGTPYSAIAQELRSMFRNVPFTDKRATLAIDCIGVGQAVFEMLVNAKLNAQLRGITIHGGNVVSLSGRFTNVPKRDLVSCVQIALQNSKLKIAASLTEAETLVRELTAFKVKISETGHDSYGNATDGLSWRDMGGLHDDLVLALACGLWVATRPGVTAGRAVGLTPV